VSISSAMNAPPIVAASRSITVRSIAAGAPSWPSAPDTSGESGASGPGVPPVPPAAVGELRVGASGRSSAATSSSTRIGFAT